MRHAHRSPTPGIADWLLVTLTYGILAWVGVDLTRDQGTLAVVWLANAVPVAILLRSRKKHAPYYLGGVFLVNIGINLYAGDPLMNAVALSVFNQIEIVLIWQLLRKLGLCRPDMQRLADLGKFCFVAGLVAPLASGLLAGWFLASGNWQSFLMFWLQWTTTNGLGMLLFGPPVMVAIDFFAQQKRPAHKRRMVAFNTNRWEWLGIQSLIVAAAVTIFGFLSFPVFFLIAPLILISAFRLGMAGTSASIVLIAVVVFVCFALETGPSNALDLSLTAKLFILQIFLLSCFAIGMVTSAILAEKARIRRTLRVHRAVTSSMLENMNEVIFRTNKKMQWEFLNPAWEKLSGRSVQESLGQNMAKLFESDGCEVLDSHLKPIRTGDTRQSRFDGWFLHQSGAKIYVELSFSRLPSEDGRFVGIVGSIIDVTQRKQIEQNLVAARKGAEKAANAKARFLASMSHEIRTPMNGVLGFAQLLHDSGLSEEQNDYAKMILDSGNAMMRLLNNVLDISKVEAGQTNVSVEPMSTEELLQNCLDLMAPVADKKRLDLALQIDESVPRLILADGNLLRQIMLNLLGNAVKFTAAGAVTVSARVDRDQHDGFTMHISVEDTGIGIPSHRHEAIFAPFEQADIDTSQNFGGTGLGLAISRQLASVMGGSIDVQSTKGKGSIFHVQFPVDKHQDESAEQKSIANGGTADSKNPAMNVPEEPEFRGKILLAEDHDINQILIVEMVKRLGYHTELAVNGQDAVQKVHAAAKENAPFDLVLMDIQMPVMDGFEATRSIRSIGYSETKLPILAITANAYPDDIEQCLKSGMQGHIAKPVMFETMKSSLRDWVAIN